MVGGPCGGSNNVAADSADIDAHQSARTSGTRLTLKKVLDGFLSAWAVLFFASATGEDGRWWSDVCKTTMCELGKVID